MTNIEIEDVLSSIRRLVSENHGPVLRPQANTIKLPGKLVLTPALRIVPVPHPVVPAFVLATPDDDPQPVFAATEHTVEFDAVSHKAAAAVLEAALSTHADDWEPDGSEVLQNPAWAVEWKSRRQRDADAPDTWAPADDAPGNDTPDNDAARLGEDVDTTDASAPASGIAGAGGGSAEASQDAGAADLSDTPLHTDTEIYADADPEPEAAFVWMDDPVRGAPETAPLPEADPFAEGANAYTDPDDSDDTLVNEEALRDLVRDILREELQGPLGERITRNVRKLVRAEINRALAARAFD